MHPYLLSREAHSTGLCDVSSADYFRTFLPRTRTAPAAHAREARRHGGGRGIRTPGAIADTTVFKTVSFGHSDSPPDLPHPTGTDSHTRSRRYGHRNRPPCGRGRGWGGRAPHLQGSLRRSPRSANKEADPGCTRPGSDPNRSYQPRRPKKFQDFLSGAGSSGWSRRPRESAGAVGGHSGTRIASIAWIAWYTSQREDLAGWTLSL